MSSKQGHCHQATLPVSFVLEVKFKLHKMVKVVGRKFVSLTYFLWSQFLNILLNTVPTEVLTETMSAFSSFYLSTPWLFSYLISCSFY